MSIAPKYRVHRIMERIRNQQAVLVKLKARGKDKKAIQASIDTLEWLLLVLRDEIR